jgi:hypothetical protein
VEIFLTGITTKLGRPIKADLNSQVDNVDVDVRKFVPAEQLRLNMSVAPAADPNRLGVLAQDNQGFPNGRRLSDDVLDIGLQALEGTAVNGVVEAPAAGDKVDANENAFEKKFPYVALPNNTAVNAGGAEVAIKPTAGGGGVPTAPLLSGLLAILLIGAGAWVLRHRAQQDSPTE